MGKIYGCFRAEPIKKGAPKSNMKKHCEATKEYAEDQRAKQINRYGYSYIEPDNVKYNRVLVDCPKSYDEVIKECNNEKFGGRTIRKDGIPMIDTVFYYSPEKTKNLLCYLHRNNKHWKQEHAEWWQAYEALPPEERREIVKAEYKWVCDWAKASEKWAEENLGQVVHCVLHCHEGTPHLDCKTLAIKEKKGKWIWAKREILGNPAHLRKMQTKYAEECGNKFGLERGEVHEASGLREHAETERHMAAVAREQEAAQLEQMQMQVLDAQGAIFDKQAELQELEQKVVAAEQQKVVAEQETAEIRTALEQLQGAVQRLFAQLQALKPKEREREKDLFAWMEKHGKVMGGGNLAEIRTTTAHISQESSRIAEQYLAPPEEPEDWEYC